MEIKKEEDQYVAGVGRMKKYTFKMNGYMNTEEIVIMARDKQTAIQIAKVLVSYRK